jgi:SAM-dependent methyltransferase
MVMPVNRNGRRRSGHKAVSDQLESTVKPLATSQLSISAPLAPSIQAAQAYDMAGRNYLSYADGDASRPFDFTSRYSFADREIWRRLEAALKRLHASGRRTLSLLDAGCGPGTWTRRVALRARQLGFERVNAFGFDISPAMIALAKSTLGSIDDQAIRMSFMVRDITNGRAFNDQDFDLCLCLYGVFNHLPVAVHDQVARELVRVTQDTLFVTVRAAGSLPTIYVDSLDHARAFYQDNVADRMEVDMLNGEHIGFTSHLFTSTELGGLFRPHLAEAALIGLDVFHSRFATDQRWNPTTLAGESEFDSDLDALEYRYASDPRFIDRSAHILLVGER